MFIQTENTPNPRALKFLPGVEVSPNNPVSYNRKNSQIDSSLCRSLFEMSEIQEVFFGHDFITITLEHEDWHQVKHEILIKIIDHFNSNAQLFDNNKEIDQASSDRSLDDEVTGQIKEIIETRVRPAVAMDGGDIVFVEFKDGIVFLELRGSCSGCPSSVVTLKNGIESMLKHYVPEVISVESVN